MKKIFTMAWLFVCVSSPAWALIALKGEDARSYLGDAKQHFLSGKYTCEILSRSHRDAMNGRFSDGVIFNAGGGLFEYPKRKDGEHILLLDSPGGREEEPVTEAYWRQKIDNTLSDDNNIPTVFLDDNHQELATAYVGSGTKLDAKILENGLLQIMIDVPGSKDHRGRRRMMM